MNNRVEDWGLRDSGDNAIHYSRGATIIGNRVAHSSLTSLAAFRTFFESTYKYAFRDNVIESANPAFAGPLDMQATGTATIASGNTSIVVTHGLVRTPTAGEIVLTPTENPTNDPGNLWVSSIGATQFTINCRADPGSSNLDIVWRAAIAQPFTA